MSWLKISKRVLFCSLRPCVRRVPTLPLGLRPCVRRVPTLPPGFGRFASNKASHDSFTEEIPSNGDRTGLMVAGVGLLAVAAGGFVLLRRSSPSGETSSNNVNANADAKAERDPLVFRARQRIQQTYGYVAGGLGISAVTAGLCYAGGLPVALAAHPWLFLGGSLALSMSTLVWTMATPADQKVRKHVAWAAFCANMGAPMCFLPALGGGLVVRAALGTAAMMSALSFAAATSETDQILFLKAPCYAGLTAVVLSSFGSLLTRSSFLHNISLYGGLAVFAGLTVLDTRRLLDAARTDERYDAINHSLSVYLDVLNVFIRMVEIMEKADKQ